MEWLIAVSIFIFSCIALYFSGELVVNNLVRLSRAIKMTPFVVSFVVMGISSSFPNLFVGIQSAIKGISELSLGDVFGNNLVALTVAVAFAIFFSKTKKIEVSGKVIDLSLIFTVISALLPLLLVVDNSLSRIDAVVLLLAFALYIWWIFTKKDEKGESSFGDMSSIKSILFNLSVYVSLLKSLIGIFILILATQGIVYSSSFFAVSMGLPLVIVGLIIVGFGNALPEVYFSIASARKGETQMILGNLLGSVIVPATLVLGVVSLINPINVESTIVLFLSRIFIFIAILSFFIFAKKDASINHKEAVFLFSIYIVFLIVAVFFSIF